MTVEPCQRCRSPLTAEQRWCVVCGARRAGADVRTLLFGAPQSPTAADQMPAGGPVSAPLVAEMPQTGGPAHAAGSGDGSRSGEPGTGERTDRSPAIARRRRAAVPVALASLAGLVAVSVTTVPASLAGSSSQDPFTVVLPAQEAQQVAQAPAAAEPAATPVEEAVAPVAETPPVVTPVTPAPVTPTPAAPDETAAGDANGDEADGGTRGGTRGGERRAPVKEEPGSPIEHVFLIALGGADVSALAADATAAPYVAGTLAEGGTLLSDYRTVARGGLADAIALVSGQDPVSQTPAGCSPTGALAGGDGCVYGAKTKHVGDQLRAAKRTWKAYVEPVAGEPAAGALVAGEPAAGDGPLARAAAACGAGSLRNPFLSFRGTVEADDCDARNVALERLGEDLKTVKTTPALAWIASDAQQGPAAADAFLQRVVPQIQDSPAYAEGGLIVIVGDQPPAAPDAGDAAGADLPVGALLLSPFTPAGRVDATPADAFTLLRTLQEIYGVDPLGHAADDGFEPLPGRLFAVRP